MQFADCDGGEKGKAGAVDEPGQHVRPVMFVIGYAGVGRVEGGGDKYDLNERTPQRVTSVQQSRPDEQRQVDHAESGQRRVTGHERQTSVFERVVRVRRIRVALDVLVVGELVALDHRTTDGEKVRPQTTDRVFGNVHRQL